MSKTDLPNSKPLRPNFKKPRKGLLPNKRSKQPNSNWLFWMVLGFIFLILLSQTNTVTTIGVPKELTYSEFYSILLTNKETARIQHLELIESTENRLEGTFNDGTEFTLHIPKEDQALLNLIRDNVPEFAVVPPQLFWSQMFFSFMPILLIILFIWFISHRGAQVGNRIWSFGKSRARMSTKENNHITFKDVAGVDEAKEELQEVIEFLKDPKKFQRLGGRIPKGVLLIGYPGTGKTLLA